MKKKLFSNKKFSKEKWKNFVNKDGFYVVLFLCVALIATSAVYITRNNMDKSLTQNNPNEAAQKVEDYQSYQAEDIKTEKTKEASANNDEKDKKEIQEKQSNANDKVSKQEERQVSQSKSNKENSTPTDEFIPNATAVTSNNASVEKNQEKQEKKSDENSSSSQNTLNSFINPVKGSTITMDYSFQASPVFSKTLNEFRSDHQGIDLAAEKGTEVKATMDGKIVEIKKDPKFGTLITIDHGNGVQSKYGNLDSKVNVTKNQQVKKGQVIGKAGNTALFEIDDDPHIHFEVWNGDKCIDPKKYIKVKK
ncbi:M23 family metallopeptidase [Garciella nitratireducens]|uniref:M23 family metallopeptidase n=1 Tax=Garciella nitratireducens TaxID=218205 RepID=UPI000DEAE655|nr:M23 family metallopeptidase [Garciella nitratireducens]RBP37815.1 murein DD-endopeptidase MepM/ murein hydrolase activator NlpD [Garciella nitratireducens]